MDMLSREVVVVNTSGLHARTAAMVSKIAQKAVSRVWLSRDDITVDASSVIDILTLACEKGTAVRLRIDDPLDLGILEDIQRLVESGFGE
jgi:phosphocarrier protein HPr